MKLIAQIVIAVVIALLIKDRIDLLLINYEIKVALEKRIEQQEKAKLEEAIRRKQNAPESNINWSGNKMGRKGTTAEALDHIIERKD